MGGSEISNPQLPTLSAKLLTLNPKPSTNNSQPNIMSNHSEDTKRIAKNTLLLYVRMLFGMLVSLYTSRVVLQTLGVEDYGIYNVVGGFVGMFSMVSNSLSSSVSRFITFELGRGDMDRLKRVFSTSISIHIVLALIIVALAETVGVWFLNTQMTIPDSRMTAANWVFQASLVAFVFGLLSVPYNASIVSHEHMNIFAYIGIADILLRLFIVLYIAYAPWVGDKLITYSLLLVAVSVSIQMFYMFYCRSHFNECRSKIHFYKAIFQEMGSFAFWNFIGCTAGLLKGQGVDIILNIFIGPVINAARGIAFTVNASITSFANNFMTALNPQITKSYAAGDYDYMNSLVERGSRFAFYIIFIFILPVMLETEFILHIWLGTYPEYTVSFVRLVLVLGAVDILSNTLVNLQAATGKIRNYQLAVGGMLMMNFPLSYICLKLGLSPVSVYIVAIVVAVCCLMLRLLFLHRMVEKFSMPAFLRDVSVNVIKVVFVSSILPLSITFLVDDGWCRLLLLVPFSMACAGCSIFWIGCNASERSFIKAKIALVFKKIGL